MESKARMTRRLQSILLIIIAAVSLIGCEDKFQPSVASKVAADIPSQESWHTKITFSDSGKVSAILHAGHIAVYENRQYTILDSNITVDFFDKDEKHTSTLTARSGKVNDITHDLEANDHVVVVSDSGTTLRTEQLFWTNLTQKIHTPLFVDITSPTEHIQGTGFESDQALKHYTIQQVTGQAVTNQ